MFGARADKPSAGRAFLLVTFLWQDKERVTKKGERGLAPLRVVGEGHNLPPNLSFFLLLCINTISVVNMQIDKIKVTFKRGKGRQPLGNFGFAEPRPNAAVGAAGGC